MASAFGVPPRASHSIRPYFKDAPLLSFLIASSPCVDVTSISPSLSGPDFCAGARVPAELDGERGAGQPLRRQPRLRRLRQVHRRRLQRIRRGKVQYCSVESNHIFFPMQHSLVSL